MSNLTLLAAARRALELAQSQATATLADLDELRTVIDREEAEAVAVQQPRRHTAKPTPGPWAVHVRQHHRVGYFCRSVWKEASNGSGAAVRHIADVKGDIGPPDVSDANAQLIAAAPDMLEALKKVRVAILDFERDGVDRTPFVARVVEEAILKAEIVDVRT